MTAWGLFGLTALHLFAVPAEMHPNAVVTFFLIGVGLCLWGLARAIAGKSTQPLRKRAEQPEPPPRKPMSLIDKIVLAIVLLAVFVGTILVLIIWFSRST